MFFARIRTVVFVLLALGVSVLGLGAGLYARLVPTTHHPGTPNAAAPGPEEQPMPDRPPARKTFANEFGYTWFTEPQDVGDRIAVRKDVVGGKWSCTVTGGSAEGDPIATVVLVEGEDGKLILIQNVVIHQENQKAFWPSFRPVVFWTPRGSCHLPSTGENGTIGGGNEAPPVQGDLAPSQ